MAASSVSGWKEVVFPFSRWHALQEDSWCLRLLLRRKMAAWKVDHNLVRVYSNLGHYIYNTLMFIYLF